ncbi:MAG: ECF-type sigma factor [Bryobacteraceae bacterium]
MSSGGGPDITALLAAWNAGDSGALERLTPHVYSELRRLADSYMRGERPGHTLQPTALVHEVYLRLVKQKLPEFSSRSHFYGLAAQLMRQVLVDSARARGASKRAGDLRRITLGESAPGADGIGLGELDDALRLLEQRDENQARAVQLHYFGGLAVAEIAAFCQRSPRSVARDLRAARIFLAREIGVAT